MLAEKTISQLCDAALLNVELRSTNFLLGNFFQSNFDDICQVDGHVWFFGAHTCDQDKASCFVHNEDVKSKENLSSEEGKFVAEYVPNLDWLKANAWTIMTGRGFGFGFDPRSPMLTSILSENRPGPADSQSAKGMMVHCSTRINPGLRQTTKPTG